MPIGSFLEGAANIWFTLYREKSENENKTWVQVKADLTQEFDEGDSHRTLEMRLLNRKQRKGEAIKSYFYDLKALYFEYDPHMSVDGFTKFFENGLDPELYAPYRLLRHSNMTMEGFKDVILSLQDIMNNKAAVSLLTYNNAEPAQQNPNGALYAQSGENKKDTGYKNNFHYQKTNQRPPRYSFYPQPSYPHFNQVPNNYFSPPINYTQHPQNQKYKGINNRTRESRSPDWRTNHPSLSGSGRKPTRSPHHWYKNTI